MSYEYSAESRRLDLPNPFRIENVFRIVTAAIEIIAGVGLLVVSRRQIFAAHHGDGSVPLLLGLLVLATGIAYMGRTFSQLRFFFGRGKPASLAPDVPPDSEGKSPQADQLKELLRQNALTYPEPKGALNGLLYGWIKELILAPVPIQRAAQRHFQTALVVLVTLLSWLVAWVGFSDSRSVAWMDLFYFLFGGFVLLRPMADRGAFARAEIGSRGLILLIIAAIFGPVLLPLVSGKLPDLSMLSLNGQTALMLVLALAAEVMFFRALLNQMTQPASTNMACEQMALSMNAHPKQLVDELERELQSNWVEKIPNRRYTRVLPKVGNGTGSFFSELVEETQPMPSGSDRPDRVAASLHARQFSWLTLLDMAGTLLVMLGMLCYLIFALRFDPARITDVLAWLSLGLVLHVIGHFCQRAAHVLWGRFEFTSQVLWVEIQGNYQAAKMEFGNQFADRIRSERQVINIETMTLRVWAAELASVSFGKDLPRYLTGLAGRPDLAREYVQRLREFAGAQSVIVAPTAQADLQKAGALAMMNQASGGGTGRVAEAYLQAAGEAQRSAAAAAVTHCPQCGAPQEADGSFCADCGTRLLPAPN